MKVYSKKTAGAFAMVATAALVLAGCSTSAEPAPGDDSAPAETPAAEETLDTLKIAGLLPQTGSLGFLMPPVEGGMYLALDDINEAGGVLGNPVEIVDIFNEGEGADRSVIDSSVDQLLSSDAAFVLGAMSTGQTLHVIDKITEAGLMMGSPSNTGAVLEGYSPLYFRTAPSDNIQGGTLAQQIISDGITDVAFLTFNDDYGIGLRDKIQQVLEDAGVNITYGGTGEGNEFPGDQRAFTSDVTAAVKSGAEGIVIVTFDQSEQIIPELQDQGFDPANIYLIDGNTNSLVGVVEAGSVVGMQGTIPGAQQGDPAFADRVEAKYTEMTGNALESFTYAPEAYDLMMLTALAAQRGGSADPQTISANVHAVSGADGGEECETYEECLALLEDGKEIHYVSKAGIGPLKNGDPSAAWIGIYEYDDSDTPQFKSEEFGEI
ncbi:MAG TPA: ABC transporter substrate-binding protein [Microbacteriaceae bacterium]|nr:ABC transporter substrate-binding protein [Microbacteriaceae bacterium]